MSEPMTPEELLVRQLVADTVRSWPKTASPKVLVDKLDHFARAVLELAALRAPVPEARAPLAESEREMLHALLQDAVALLDPEEHSDVCEGINTVLVRCVDVGRCEPPSSASISPPAETLGKTR